MKVEKEYIEIASKLDSVEELKKLSEEYDKEIGYYKDRLKSVATKIEKLQREKEILESTLGRAMLPVRDVITRRIGELILCGESYVDNIPASK